MHVVWPTATPTHVHPLETSVSDAVPCDSPAWEANDATGIAFRHSGWNPTRQRINAALNELYPFSEVVERFQQCGSQPWLYRMTVPPYDLQLRCNRCRNRWCVPCQRERAAKLAARFIPALVLHETRFLTLTLKSAPTDLTTQLNRLYKCYRKLRRTELWRCHIKGALAFCEVTRSGDTGQWHPHLHVLVHGTYLRHAELRDTWHSITGDSWIVDIRRPNNTHDTLRYLTTYVTKAVPASVTRDQTSLIEAMTAFKGRRLFIATGTLGRIPDPDPETDPDIWQPVCRLSELLASAARHDEWAMTVLAQLRKEPSCEHQTGPPGKDESP